MIDNKPFELECCLYCRYYQQTSFSIDNMQPTHWQRVRRYGLCLFRKIVWGESFETYTADFHSCPEWKSKHGDDYQIEDAKKDLHGGNTE